MDTSGVSVTATKRNPVGICCLRLGCQDPSWRTYDVSDDMKWKGVKDNDVQQKWYHRCQRKRMKNTLKMEVEEETDCKNKWDEQKKNLQRQLRDIIDRFASLDQVFRDRQKDIWKEELEEIERKRTELLTEHQKIQKRTQKLQNLQDKQKNHFNNACACEEVRMLNEEMEERKALHETRFLALSEKSGDSRKAAAELEVEIQALQAREERRGSSASQSNQWMLLRSSSIGAGLRFWRNTGKQFNPFHAARVCQAVQGFRLSRARGMGRRARSFGRSLG